MTQLFIMRGVAAVIAAALVAGASPASGRSATVEVGLGTSLVGTDSGALLADAAPGQTFTQRMRVSNGSTRDEDIQLYAGAVWRENGTLIDDAAGGVNALSDWISVERNQVRVAAGEIAEFDFTITVPDDAPDAEQHAVVWAATGAARSGVRVGLTVAGNNGPAPRFSVDRLRPTRLANGELAIEVPATAVGPRASSLSGALRLIDGPGNRWIPEKPALRTALEPGTTTVVRVPMGAGTGLPAGPWTARGFIHNGYDRVRIDEPVVFPDIPTPGPGGSSSGSLGSLSSSS